MNFAKAGSLQSALNGKSQVKKQAQKAYQIWLNNQSYPSLHFKKVGKNLWSTRITRDYRALALKRGDDYYWIWIGTHDEYKIFLKSED